MPPVALLPKKAAPAPAHSPKEPRQAGAAEGAAVLSRPGLRRCWLQGDVVLPKEPEAFTQVCKVRKTKQEEKETKAKRRRPSPL